MPETGSDRQRQTKINRGRIGQTPTHTHTNRQNKTRQDKTRQDKTRQNKTKQDKTRQDKTRKTRHEDKRWGF